MMKPEILPMIRDAGRLLVLDIEETASSYRKRQRHLFRPTGKRAFREALWPNARWWHWQRVTELDQLPQSRTPHRTCSVVAAWQALANADVDPNERLANVIHILIETPSVEQHIADTNEQIDLRLMLSDRRKTREWLIASRDHWHTAVDLLVDRSCLSRETGDALQKFGPTASFCPDPWVFAHYRCAKDLLEVSWTEKDVRSGLAFFRGGTLRRVRAALGFLERLGREDHQTLIRLQHFLLTANPGGAADWLRLIGWIKNESHRKQFIEWIHHSEARRESPARIGDPLFRKLIHQADLYARSHIETAGILPVIQGKVDAEVMHDFFKIQEALTSVGICTAPPQKSQYRPEANSLIELGVFLIEEDGAQSQRYYRSGSRLVLSLWKGAINSKPLLRIIQDHRWEQWAPELTRGWIQMYLVINDLAKKPKEFLFILSLVEASIDKAPASEQKMKLEALGDTLDWLCAKPSRLLWETIDHAAGVIAAGKFSKYPQEGVSLFIDFYFWGSFEQRWSLSFVKRSVIKAMEDAMRNTNDFDSLSDGAKAFMKRFPEIDLSLCFRAPKVFLRVLRELGDLPTAERDRLLDWYAEHPAITFDPLRTPVSDAVVLVDTIRPSGSPDPIPAKLRATQSSSRPMRDDILEHYREEFANRWAVCFLEMLRKEIQHTYRRLQQANLELHTIRFLARLGKENRRGFRRFLFEIETQNSNYRDHHPANRAWLSQHRNLTLSEWTRRNTEPLPVEIEGITEATIRLEDDPQEELKMGTYVSSCLSVGGCNQFSTVANTLDINKRIAYLKDHRGKVFARQLYAISEQEQLVPFEVYTNQLPDECSRTALLQAFITFTERLARKLDLPLWTPGNDYQIRPLLVPSWYDDQAWDLRV